MAIIRGQGIIQEHWAKGQISGAIHLKARFQEEALEEAALVSHRNVHIMEILQLEIV